MIKQNIVKISILGLLCCMISSCVIDDNSITHSVNIESTIIISTSNNSNSSSSSLNNSTIDSIITSNPYESTSDLLINSQIDSSINSLPNIDSTSDSLISSSTIFESSTPEDDYNIFELPLVSNSLAVINNGGSMQSAKDNPNYFTYNVSENCYVTRHELINRKLYFSYEGGYGDKPYDVQLAYSQKSYDFSRRYEVSYKVIASVDATLIINHEDEIRLLANQAIDVKYVVYTNDCQMYTYFGGQPGEYIFFDFYMRQLPLEIYTPLAPLANQEYFYAPTDEEKVINGFGYDTYEPVSNRGKFVYWEARHIYWTNGVSATKVTASYDEVTKVLDYSFIVTEGKTVDNQESGFWAAQLFYSSPATINHQYYELSVTIEAAQNATIRVCDINIELKAGVPKVVNVDTKIGNDANNLRINPNVAICFGWMPTGWPSGEIFPGSYKLYNWSIKPKK